MDDFGPGLYSERVSLLAFSLVATCLRRSFPIVVWVTARFVDDLGADPDSERVSLVTVLVLDLKKNNGFAKTNSLLR